MLGQSSSLGKMSKVKNCALWTSKGVNRGPWLNPTKSVWTGQQTQRLTADRGDISSMKKASARPKAQLLRRCSQPCSCKGRAAQAQAKRWQPSSNEGSTRHLSNTPITQMTIASGCTYGCGKKCNQNILLAKERA